VLVYRAYAAGAEPVTPASLKATIAIMRKRVAQLGPPQPQIQATGPAEITVALSDVTNGPSAQEEVRKSAQLYFYDWEPNVIGADGQPAPTQTTGSNPRPPGPQAGEQLAEKGRICRLDRCFRPAAERD
jgi:preprotein translocase subunit SecD